MIKNKLKVIIISFLLVILIAPILFPLESYSQTVGIYASIGSVLIIFVGIPVTFLAGVITRRMKRHAHAVNFLIHILPAVIISVTMFDSIFIAFTLPFASVPIFASTVFYVVDEVIYHKIDLSGRLQKGIFFIPIAVTLLFVGPSLYNGYMTHQATTQLSEKGPPKAILTFAGEDIPITGGYCWASNGEDCADNPKPFPLPESRVNNVKEVTITSPALLDFTFEKSVGKPTISAYYHDGNHFKEIKKAGSKVEIPGDIPEQAIKFVVTWENNEIFAFFVGVRTGVPTNGRTF